MNHSNNDCLLITILTHGDFGTISSYDEDYTLRSLTEPFTDENCPTLKGKPRLFFIQACRGSSLDHGHDVRTENRKVSSSRRKRKYSERSDALPFENGNKLKMEEEEEEEDMLHNNPKHRDFLIVRSTMPQHLSFREKNSGTWFIQALCTDLEVCGSSENVLHLLAHVNLNIAEKETKGTNFHKKKQILCVSSSLTKILIFGDKSKST
jgi:caspase 7